MVCFCIYTCVSCVLITFVFFFFKQETAYDMRISDWSSDVCSSDLPADEVDAGRAGRLRGAAGPAVPGHRRPMDGEHPDDDHHDRGRLPVRLGVGVPGRTGRFVQQPGLGHHHRHDPVRFAGAGAVARALFADRRDSRDHDRRGGVLPGRGRRRQPAGPTSRRHRRTPPSPTERRVIFRSIPMTIIMIVAGFLFVSVSAYLAGLVGSSNNPVSGITIATILFASLVLVLLLGRDSPIGAIAAIMIGAVVCCAAAVGGDNLQDLKAGYIVGATPWKQQLMLAIGAFSCALIMAPVLNLLAQAYGIGAPTPEHPNSLAAPQATLMASVANGMFGGKLPWTMIAIGAAIGAAIIALDEWLKARKSNFRVPVLAAAIGIYLPLELMVPIFLGGLLSYFVERRKKLKDGDA